MTRQGPSRKLPGSLLSQRQQEGAQGPSRMAARRWEHQPDPSPPHTGRLLHPAPPELQELCGPRGQQNQGQAKRQLTSTCAPGLRHRRDGAMMRHDELLLLAHSPTRLFFLQPPSRATQGTPVPFHHLCCDKEGQGPRFCNKQCVLMALVLQEGGRSLRRSWFPGCQPQRNGEQEQKLLPTPCGGRFLCEGSQGKEKNHTPE